MATASRRVRGRRKTSSIRKFAPSAARLDNTLEIEIHKFARVDILILGDFALRPLDATETNDFYEIVMERHRKASTIVTSNREPAEWPTVMIDALLAQMALGEVA